MTGLVVAFVAASCLLIGLVTGAFLAARYEVERERERVHDLHRRYGSHRRVS